MDKLGNRRQHFRVRMNNCTGTLWVLEVGGRPVALAGVPVHVMDISGGGLQVAADVDLPIRMGILCDFLFSVQNEEFRVKGELLWKRDDRKRYYYGATFLDIPEGLRAKLIRSLHILELEQHRRTQARGD